MEQVSTINIEDIEVDIDSLDLIQAATVFKTHGCLVVRGLMRPYVDDIVQDIEASAAKAIALMDRAVKIPEGWRTPDGTLCIPSPEGYARDKQIMVLAVSYQTSSAFLRSAMDETTLDLIEAIVGPDIELFDNGQCLYKEPVGGHPKHLHQDSAYFEHRYEGPVGALGYMVDTDLNNGALHVVPGSHRLGQLQHTDTFSHLGLEEQAWPWERALPVIGRAGDAILFHVKTIHGSKQNFSDRPRPVAINRYRRPDDYIVISATTAANRAEAEKHAAEVRDDNRRGLMVRGFRSYEEEADSGD